MSWGAYGILILFGLFVLLLIVNPNLSCFGRTLKSPFYPLRRKKRQKRIKSEDYGFHLVDETRTNVPLEKNTKVKPEDYGFDLSEEKEKNPPLDQKQ